MKEIKYYQETGMIYPRKSDYVRFQVNSVLEGTVVHEGLTEDELEDIGFSTVTERQEGTRQKLDNVEYLVIHRFDEAGYKTHEASYAERQNALMDEFFRDLAESEGFDPESKIAKLVYSEAWDRGHSAGLSEVASDYSSVADFAEQIIAASKTDAEA